MATRALWLSAGGEASQIDYAKEPADRWAELWNRTLEAGWPSPAFVLREALFDHPGDGVLLPALSSFAPDPAQSVEAAGFLVSQLEALKIGFSRDHLIAALRSLPEWTPAETIAVITSHFQDRFPRNYRDRLEGALLEIRKETSVLSLETVNNGARSLVANLPKVEDPELQKAIETARSEFSAAAESPLEKISELVAQARQRSLSVAVAAVDRHLTVPDSGELETLGYPHIAATACLHGLWCTIGLPAEKSARTESGAEGESARAEPPTEPTTAPGAAVN